MAMPDKDYRLARLFSGTTKFLKYLPPVDRLIEGSAAKQFPDGWEVAPEGSAYLGRWVHFSGDKGLLNRLPIPTLYKSIGIMAVEAEEIRSSIAINHGARQGLAVRLGENAVVVGALQPGSSFPEQPYLPSRLLVPGAIGHEELVAQPVVWLPERTSAPDAQRMVPLESAEYFATMRLPVAREYVGDFI